MSLSCAFAEVNAAPSAGSFGLSARIAVLNDFLPGEFTDLLRNPNVGLGLRYHALNKFMLELILSGGYTIENNVGSPDTEYVSAGGGLGVYYWIPSTGNLSKYFGWQQLLYIYEDLNSDQRYLQVVGALQFGMQYNFTRNLVVFGNFGVGGGLYTEKDKSRSYFQIHPPQVGVVFCF